MCQSSHVTQPSLTRHELYPGYKGQRAPMPDEIAAALPKLVELLELMHIPAFQVNLSHSTMCQPQASLLSPLNLIACGAAGIACLGKVGSLPAGASRES